MRGRWFVQNNCFIVLLALSWMKLDFNNNPWIAFSSRTTLEDLLGRKCLKKIMKEVWVFDGASSATSMLMDHTISASECRRGSPHRPREKKIKTNQWKKERKVESNKREKGVEDSERERAVLGEGECRWGIRGRCWGSSCCRGSWDREVGLIFRWRWGCQVIWMGINDFHTKEKRKKETEAWRVFFFFKW